MKRFKHKSHGLKPSGHARANMRERIDDLIKSISNKCAEQSGEITFDVEPEGIIDLELLVHKIQSSSPNITFIRCDEVLRTITVCRSKPENIYIDCEGWFKEVVI